MSKQKILLTGTAGFIAGNFIRKAIFDKLPYEFVSIDKITNNNLLNNIFVNKSHQFYMNNICDRHFIDLIFQYHKFDYLIHYAASTHVDKSIESANEFIENNVLGTQVLIDACVKHNVKMLYFSTDEVYGALKSENDISWTEDSEISPNNPYAASKAAGELLVKAAGKTHGLDYVITRSSNIYGPRQTPDKLIPKIIKCILEDKPIPIYGKGMQIRDWTNVIDNAQAVVKILENWKSGEIYNISANQEFSNIEVVQEICNFMNKGHNLITFVEDRKGHDFRYSINSSKIKKLGRSPSYRFKGPEGGLSHTVNWYKANQWFLK